MLRKVYVAFASLTLAVYGGIAFTGFEFGTPEREPVSAELRGTHGYRTHYIFMPGHQHGK